MSIILPSLITIVCSCLCLLAFAWAYERWMHRETFYQANRIYLLVTPLLALLIPHVKVDVLLTEATPSVVRILKQTQTIPAAWLHLYFAQPSRYVWSLGLLLLVLYFGGVLLTLLRSAKNYAKIWLWIRQGKLQSMDNWTLVEQQAIPEVASFFNFIFWKNDQPLPAMVLQHELIHVQQGHSWDVLLMEIWTALHWFNPLIYRMRQRLQETHEFIADAGVIEMQGSTYAYACLLASQLQKTEQMPYNTFAAQLSSRLRRMTQQASPQWKVLQYALCLPLIMSLGMFFSVNYLQALPLPATTQNVQQIFQQLAEMPLLPASEVPAVAQKRQMLPFFTPQVLNSLFEQDTTPAVLKTFQDAKPNKRKEAIAKNPKILVIVDGKKLGTLENGGEAALDKIDVATIATVNILKDESAVAIYGEEGKDGVIIINTKKGESSDAAVVVNTVIDQPASDVKPAIAAGADARNDHEPMPAQSFDDSKLLIIVDGKNWGHISSDSKNSPLNAINPEDIATMDVLKGKTAIEKYGKEGENGVIEIRTKTKMKVKTKN